MRCRGRGPRRPSGARLAAERSVRRMQDVTSMIQWRPFALAVASFAAFLTAAEWGVSTLERATAAREAQRQAEAWGLHVSSADQELRVTVQKPRDFGAGRLAVTDLVAPRALVDSIGLAPRGKWTIVTGSPYLTPEGMAVTGSPPYDPRHCRGRRRGPGTPRPYPEDPLAVLSGLC